MRLLAEVFRKNKILTKVDLDYNYILTGNVEKFKLLSEALIENTTITEFSICVYRDFSGLIHYIQMEKEKKEKEIILRNLQELILKKKNKMKIKNSFF